MALSGTVISRTPDGLDVELDAPGWSAAVSLARELARAAGWWVQGTRRATEAAPGRWLVELRAVRA